MNKKRFISIITFAFSTFYFSSLFSKIEIKVLVNDEIITNIDINKEKEYLKILNPI